jgi:hypothetical protein
LITLESSVALLVFNKIKVYSLRIILLFSAPLAIRWAIIILHEIVFKKKKLTSFSFFIENGMETSVRESI